jgi:hypothetical protein
VDYTSINQYRQHFITLATAYRSTRTATHFNPNGNLSASAIAGIAPEEVLNDHRLPIAMVNNPE